MHIRSRTLTTISVHSSAYDMPFIEIHLDDPLYMIDIIMNAARDILVHEQGGKIAAIKFLRSALHPTDSTNGLSLSEAYRLVEDLSANLHHSEDWHE